jgi:hypothetical protein
MPEWWTYTLSDFLMFSPRTYYRLIERYNVALWPAHILTMGLGLLIFSLLRGHVAWQGRTISMILALLWAWITGAFLWARYATINWAVIYLLPLFAIEVLLLAWIGVIRGRLSFNLSADLPGILGIGLFLCSLVLYPTLGPLLGRGWRQSEVFGLAPDPTVIGTLGLALLARRERPSWELITIPVLWCLISGATLFAIASPVSWVPPTAGVLSVFGYSWLQVQRRPQVVPESPQASSSDSRWSG